MKNITTLYLPQNTLYRDDYVGPVYRFFSEETYAEDFINGKIFLSTLETCRGYEDSERGDKEEGYQKYQSGNIVGDGDDPDFVEKARRTGVSVGPNCRNITIANCSSIETINDAYVLCTTVDFLPENFKDSFGKYCVKILHPEKFFIAISKKIQSTHRLKNGLMGKVIYRDREYTELEPPPGPLGFVKPAIPYESQKEFRFLWDIDERPKLEPVILDCPETKGMCKPI